jgi:hypothetical protein
MSHIVRLALGWTLFASVVAITACVWLFQTRAEAQNTQGQNAVCTSQTLCSGSTVGTRAFIDASMFLNPGQQGNDLCDTINGILGSRFGVTYPPHGAVIDARGISTNLT